MVFHHECTCSQWLRRHLDYLEGILFHFLVIICTCKWWTWLSIRCRCGLPKRDGINQTPIPLLPCHHPNIDSEIKYDSLSSPPYSVVKLWSSWRLWYIPPASQNYWRDALSSHPCFGSFGWNKMTGSQAKATITRIHLPTHPAPMWLLKQSLQNPQVESTEAPPNSWPPLNASSHITFHFILCILFSSINKFSVSAEELSFMSFKIASAVNLKPNVLNSCRLASSKIYNYRIFQA